MAGPEEVSAPTEADIGSVIAAVNEVVTASFVTITPDTPLLSSSIVDSLAIAELSSRLTASFGVELGVGDLVVDKADTPRQIAQLVVNRTAGP